MFLMCFENDASNNVQSILGYDDNKCGFWHLDIQIKCLKSVSNVFNVFVQVLGFEEDCDLFYVCNEVRVDMWDVENFCA